MPRRRSHGQGQQIVRPSKPFIVIVCEGKNTEPGYFHQFGGAEGAVSIKCLSAGGKSPSKLLGKMREFIRQYPLAPNGEAWIVVDRNSWAAEELDRVSKWAQSNQRYGFALSNPQIEYWLLLHFENGHGIGSAQDCVNRLKHHFPQYSKSRDSFRFEPSQIQLAIDRAKQRYPACPRGWPDRPGTTSVHKLVEKLLDD